MWSYGEPDIMPGDLAASATKTVATVQSKHADANFREGDIIVMPV